MECMDSCKERKMNFGENMKKLASWNESCTVDSVCLHTLGWTCLSGHSKAELQQRLMNVSALPHPPKFQQAKKKRRSLERWTSKRWRYKYFFWYGGGGDRRYRTTSTPVTPQRMDVGDFDWRTTGAVNPIRDQGQCGACWSFAAVAAIETTSNYVNGRLNTERRSYSEQWLLDCSTRNGCDGGWPSDAIAYVQSRGLARAEADVYVGRETKCPRNTSGLDKPVSGQVDLTGNPIAIQQYILNNGPVTAGFYVCENFMHYTGGVYSTDCSPDDPDYLGGHAVAVIGYGTTSNGVDYWLVRNQWGTGWGQAGYFQILRGSDISSFESWGVTGVKALKLV
ncbi:unnamed protein product, partial [Mesorhabditis belari]|uniref:Peptidase C1A papain C-terminal domain-containing protein n=1 Tax=Mesorhabditis belari TaxID=2138241 RepID=A0AAF3FL42_9BILA